MINRVNRVMDFNELNQLLVSAACGSRAAECHGFLCGYLCVRDDVEISIMKDCLLAESEDDDFAAKCLEQLSRLSRSVSAEIDSQDFSLRLLLPGEDASLSDRSAALVEWCEGFLSGLGTAGVTDFDLLSHECRELIQDLYKICRLDTVNVRDSNEADETALTELIEYVRMGAILVHDEIRREPQQSIKPSELH